MSRATTPPQPLANLGLVGDGDDEDMLGALEHAFLLDPKFR